MSKPITQAIQDKLKLHMAIFALLGVLIAGFSITDTSEIPLTRLFVVIYLGVLMMWAFLADLRKDENKERNVEETLRLLYLDLKKMFDPDIIEEAPKAALTEEELVAQIEALKNRREVNTT